MSEYQLRMDGMIGQTSRHTVEAIGNRPPLGIAQTENDLWRGVVKVYRKYHAPLIAAANKPENPNDPGAEAVALFDAALCEINALLYGTKSPLADWFAEIYGVLDEEYKQERLKYQQNCRQI